MKSRTYSNKWTSKGKLWIPVTFFIALFMAFPVACLIKLGDWSGVDYTARQMEILYENLWANGLVSTGYGVVLLAGVLVSVANFWYLYSKSKVDFYHSLPVTRRRMFLIKTGEGICYFLIPYVLMVFLTICIGAMRGYFSLSLMGDALRMLLIHLLVYLLVYFSSSLAICLTGNILMGGLCLTALILYGPAAGLVLDAYQSNFFKTYAWTTDRVKTTLTNLSPVFLGSSFMETANVADPSLTVQVALTVLVFGGCAYAAFVRRPSEKTGKSLVYPFTQVILHLLVVVPFSLGIGIVFYMIPQNDENRLLWWMFGMAAGLLISHMLVEILFHMDFRKCFSQKLLLLGAGLCTAAAALCFQMDMFGYDRYMPKEKELESILFSGDVFGEETGPVVNKREDGRYEIGQIEDVRSVLNSYGRDGYHVGNSQEVYEIVKKAAQISREMFIKNQTDGPALSPSGEVMRPVTVQFCLKSGRRACRSYFFEKRDIREILRAGYRDGVLKEEKYSFLEIEPEYLRDMYMTAADGEYASDLDVDRAELLEALRQDVLEADGEVLTGVPCGMLHFTFHVPVPEQANNQIPNEGTATSYVFEAAYLFPEFKRTLAILKKTGYPLSIDEVPIDKVMVQYYRTDGEPVVYSEDVVYDQEEELRELKKAMVAYELAPRWLSNSANVPDLVSTVTTEAGGEENSGWVLLNEDCPSFILEDGKKAKLGAFGEVRGEEEVPLLPETESMGEITILEESGTALDEEETKKETE